MRRSLSLAHHRLGMGRYSQLKAAGIGHDLSNFSAFKKI
jgi:hypothetical protein